MATSNLGITAHDIFLGSYYSTSMTATTGYSRDAVPAYGTVHFADSSLTINCVVELDTGSTNGLVTLKGTTRTIVTDNGVWFYFDLDLNYNIQGSATITVTDRRSGLQAFFNVNNVPLIENVTPGYISPTNTITVSSDKKEWAGYGNEDPVAIVNALWTYEIGEVAMGGDRCNVKRYFSDTNWQGTYPCFYSAHYGPSGMREQTGTYSIAGRHFLASVPANTGATTRSITYFDIICGNPNGLADGSDTTDAYLYTLQLTQLAASVDPDSGATPDTGTTSGITPTPGVTITGFNENYAFYFDGQNILQVSPVRRVLGQPGCYNFDPFDGMFFGRGIEFYPANAEYDFEVTCSNTDMFPHPNTVLRVDYAQTNPIRAFVDLHIPFLLGVSGSSVITLTDKISGKSTSRTFYNNIPSSMTPSVYFTDSAITISSAATATNPSTDYSGTPIERISATTIETNGTSLYPFGAFRPTVVNSNVNRLWKLTDISNFTPYKEDVTYPKWNPSSSKPSMAASSELRIENYDESPQKAYVFFVKENSGETRTAIFNKCFIDADKNTFNTRIMVTQEAGSGYTPDTGTTPDTGSTIHITPSTQSVSSSDTSVCMSIVAENVTFDHAEITGTSGNWYPMPTSAVNGNNICFSFDRNQGDSRTANYSVKLYDTDGNSYDASVSLTQEAKDDSYDGGKISHPINNHYSPGMLKLRTTLEDGQIYTTGNASFNPGLGYTKQVCSPYVLYYLNSYGGWDAFVIEGTVIKKETINSYMTDRAFNNTTIEFEANKYVNEIKTNYELNTGLLNDEESANLAKNLLGSLKVYMHNLDEGWVKPVIIMDNNITYQTYQTNGKKLSQYRINVQMSQSKIRK